MLLSLEDGEAGFEIGGSLEDGLDRAGFFEFAVKALFIGFNHQVFVRQIEVELVLFWLRTPFG